MRGFCCVTAFFNPAGYRSRARNYRIFADRLADQGVRLVTAELALADRPFEIPESDDIIRLRSGSVMWQKERLVNYAVSALPPECDRVAWLDADLLFPERGWVEQVAEALDKHDVVQLFSEVRHLAPGVCHPNGDVLESDISLVCQATEFPDWMARRKAGELPFAVPGYAWAARRSVFSAAGLYDRLILGNGDAFLADCLLGSLGMHHYWHSRTPGMAADMDRWRIRFLAPGGARVGLVPGVVFHLWHGRFVDRRYRDRDAILLRHNFDPTTDVDERNGVHEWSSDKPELHAEVHSYFLSRDEDA